MTHSSEKLVQESRSSLFGWFLVTVLLYHRTALHNPLAGLCLQTQLALSATCLGKEGGTGQHVAHALQPGLDAPFLPSQRLRSDSGWTYAAEDQGPQGMACGGFY